MQTIDLRSDTLTRPDAAMRRAMAEAEVGDDVYREDPTVRLLEEEAAARLGFESALFVPSGIMGNQIGLRLLAPRGSELLCDTRAHVVLFEYGAMSALSGIQPRVLESKTGLPEVAAFDAAYSAPGGYQVATGAVALENTHNVAGGRVFGRERLDPVLAWARERGLPVHLDGARIWNAATALGVAPAELARGFDTVMACLSKGLGAPVGSVLCSSAERIEEARAIRRLFGGQMRQVGVLAAAGLVALREGPARLAVDHENARRLASAIAELPGVEVDLDAVETNIGIVRVLDAPPGESPAAGFVGRLEALGVRTSLISSDLVRFVTHRDVPAVLIDEAIERLSALR